MPDGRWEGEFIVKDGEMMSDLIRCKDCKYYDLGFVAVPGKSYCVYHPQIIAVEDYDYCSRGELREDAQ